MNDDILRTIDQSPINEGIERPSVWRPVRMTEASCKRKQPAQDLLGLSPVDEWAKRSSKDQCYAQSKLDAIGKLRDEDAVLR